MQAKKFNAQIFLELLCYIAFVTLMTYLLISGKYLSYVTPRMKPYLIFSAIVMGVWTLSAMARLFRPQYKLHSSHCFVLVIPILLMLLPHNTLGISDISSGYVRGNIVIGQSAQPENTSAGLITEKQGDTGTESANETHDSIVPDTSDNAAKEYNSGKLPGLDEANKTITVSNDDFGMWLDEIYSNMKKYDGFEIIMTGYVFKDPEMLGSDEFVPARLMMSCCVADLVPTGLIAKYDNVSELIKDSWVTVEGTLFIAQYRYGDMSFNDPQIKVTKITPAEAVPGFIYPYY